MKFNYKNKFNKKFKKLSIKIKEKIIISLKKLKDGNYDKSLNLHRLTGDLKKYHTINVTGDIRILLNIKTGEIVDVLDIGNHNYFY